MMPHPCSTYSIYLILTQFVFLKLCSQFGFGLARAPYELTMALQEGIRGGLERGEVWRNDLEDMLLLFGVEVLQLNFSVFYLPFSFWKERFEYEVEVIEGARTLFIDRPDLTQRVRLS